MIALQVVKFLLPMRCHSVIVERWEAVSNGQTLTVILFSGLDVVKLDFHNGETVQGVHQARGITQRLITCQGVLVNRAGRCCITQIEQGGGFTPEGIGDTEAI